MSAPRFDRTTGRWEFLAGDRIVPVHGGAPYGCPSPPPDHQPVDVVDVVDEDDGLGVTRSDGFVELSVIRRWADGD